MLGPDRQRIRDILFRMALSETTLSANAVLLSLLALSSYHRGGVLEYASHMKDAALRALIAAADPEMDSNAAIRHVAAGLILCLVEVRPDNIQRECSIDFLRYSSNRMTDQNGSAMLAARNKSSTLLSRCSLCPGATLPLFLAGSTISMSFHAFPFDTGAPI
jgi:hypothetical protein